MNGASECPTCGGPAPTSRTRAVSMAYNGYPGVSPSRQRTLNVLLVSADCLLTGLQPLLVYMAKVDGKFMFSPVSVNFLAEIAKLVFAVLMLFCHVRRQSVGDKPFLSFSSFVKAAQDNVLLAVPSLLYAVGNYLKFIMQLYFNPATVKMLSNLKVLVVAVLYKFIMRKQFSVIQWEALALLLIGITMNQLTSQMADTTALGLSVTSGAYLYTLVYVTVPALGSVYNEKVLKSNFETSIYFQNLFLFGYGALFNFLGILITAAIQGPSSLDILKGHSKATMFLICNNAAQGILATFFFKYADTILKKYSSTIATIFTGVASAALFGHTLTINFILGISIVMISMHQYLSTPFKEEKPNNKIEMVGGKDSRSKDVPLINVIMTATEDDTHIHHRTHAAASDEQDSLINHHTQSAASDEWDSQINHRVHSVASEERLLLLPV